MEFRTRPLRPADTRPVVALFRRTAQEDRTVGEITEEGWSRFVDQEVNRGGEGFLVCEEDGRVVGVATSSLRHRPQETVRHFRIVVDPGHRRAGIGSALLSGVHGLDPGRPEVEMQALCNAEALAGVAFLEHFGFTQVESELEMRSDAREIPFVRSQPGVKIEKSEDPRRVAARLADLHNAAYAGDVSFVALTPEGMGRLLAQDAEVYLALDPEDEIVGYCHTEPGRAATWIESVVVDAPWRGRGLASLLLARALWDVRQRGQVARLLVSDRNPAAITVYTRLGFSVVSRSTRYRAPRAAVGPRLRSGSPR